MYPQPASILDFLKSKDLTFFIPPYQRNYEWDKEICAVLFDDVQRVAESNENGVPMQHFFGTIVFVIEPSGPLVPDRYVLTDGQQRITTTMLLLMALRDSIEDAAYKELIQEEYLQNSRAGDDTEYKIKLKQVESDWDAYKTLALGREVGPDMENSRVYQNYLFFLKKLSPLSEAQKKMYFEKGLAKFNTISIQLEPDRNQWENPQEVFESMNSLGKPLTLADLARNYLLLGKQSEEQTRLYNDYWLKLERRLPGSISSFIRDWMQSDQHQSYKVATVANYKELYSQLKQIVSGRPVEELFDVFVAFSRPYAAITKLEPTGNSRVDQALFDLNTIGSKSAYSYIAELLQAWELGRFTDPEIVRLLEALRSYLLRRRVLGLTTGENKFFPTLGARIGELAGAATPSDVLFNQFSSQEYALRVPNDAELRLGLETVNFYNLGKGRVYPKLLLSLAEEGLTRARPRWDDPNLQLEHIMPQTLNRQWRDDLGETYEEVHQELLNNIGNVTLIRHNQELGNKGFASKVVVYSGSSGLQVSQNKVIDNQVWNKETIEARRDYLIRLLTNNVLAVPDNLRTSNNWKQTGKQTGKFDSRKVLTRLVGRVITYVDDESVTAKVLSGSRVEFEGKQWYLSPLTRELKRRAGQLTQSGSYQGALFWQIGGERLTDLSD